MHEILQSMCTNKKHYYATNINARITMKLKYSRFAQLENAWTNVEILGWGRYE